MPGYWKGRCIFCGCDDQSKYSKRFTRVTYMTGSHTGEILKTMGQKVWRKRQLRRK